MPRLKVFSISGSIRKESINTALLVAMQEIAGGTMDIEIYDGLSGIPPYDDDVRQQGFPPCVEALRGKVRAADALIIATPEYNRSFSGVLKNAIDWLSRPPEQPLKGKPALVTGAGPGALGTALANYQLRQVLSVLGVHVLPGMEVLVGGSGEKFDQAGSLTHGLTRDALRRSLAELDALAKVTAGLAAPS